MNSDDTDKVMLAVEQILFLAESVLSMLESGRYSEAEIGTGLVIEKARSIARVE